MMSQAGENPFKSNEFSGLPDGFRAFFWIFQHFQLIGILQVAVSILLLVSGIQFLRLKSWARSILEGFSWFSAVAIFVFTGLWIAM